MRRFAPFLCLVLSASAQTPSGGVDGGPPLAQVSGTVYYDTDGDGVRDLVRPIEPPIAGWRVEMTDGLTSLVTFTDQMGRYTFEVPFDRRLWLVQQFAPLGGHIPRAGAVWLSTTTREAYIRITDQTVPAPAFGNLQFELQPGVGRGPDWWSTIGPSFLANCDPAFRFALGTSVSNAFLRNPVISTDPQLSLYWVPLNLTFTQASSSLFNWFQLAPNSDHLGYLLSRELAATILSNTCGFMQGLVYIDRFGDGSLVSLGEMIADARSLLVDPCSGLVDTNTPTVCLPIRKGILNCINEFTTINRSQNLIERQVVYTPKSNPDKFGSPYTR